MSNKFKWLCALGIIIIFALEAWTLYTKTMECDRQGGILIRAAFGYACVPGSR